MFDKVQDGRFFRTAWTNGVTKHFPGTAKPGYIKPWEEMPEWEQESAIAVYGKTRAFILAGLQGEQPVRVAPEQGGRFIAEAWNVQVYRHIHDPKSGYVADWDDLPKWQCLTDRDIFGEIQSAVLQESVNA